MNTKNILLIIATVVVYVGCKNTETIADTNKVERINVKESCETDSLPMSKSQMLSLWLDDRTVDMSAIYPKFRSGHYMLTTDMSIIEDEIRKCEIIPVKHYKIDAQWKQKLKLDPSQSIDSLLTLNDEYYSFNVARHDTLFLNVRLRQVDGVWRWSSCGAQDMALSDTITERLRKGQRQFRVDVGSRSYLVFKEANELIYVGNEGYTIPFRKRLLQEVDWWVKRGMPE